MSGQSPNRILLLAGGVLAALSLAAALIFPNGMDGVSTRPRFISVLTLAEQIKDRKLLRIVDLRADSLYQAFHLPGAVNAWLPEESGTDTLVFYSGDDLLARQRWASLPASVRARSYVLYGGVRDWFERLLYPELPLVPVAGQERLMKQVEDLSNFYGGQPEYMPDTAVLQYYKIDLERTGWPAVRRGGRLVRKGC